jgi:hypothetical protein
MNTATGAISGTPLNTQDSAVYTVTGTNSGGSATVLITIVTLMQPPVRLHYAPAMSAVDTLLYVFRALSHMKASTWRILSTSL